MAQSGYTPILIYASGTTGNTPSAGNLTSSASGAELALNYFDGKLFYKDASGNVQVLATKGGVGNSSDTQILYNSSGLVTGSANMTYNGSAVSLAANLLFTDNTYDIGASGANRPKNLYASGNAYFGTNTAPTTEIRLNAAGGAGNGGVYTIYSAGSIKSGIGPKAVIAGTGTDQSLQIQSYYDNIYLNAVDTSKSVLISFAGSTQANFSSGGVGFANGLGLGGASSTSQLLLNGSLNGNAQNGYKFTNSTAGVNSTATLFLNANAADMQIGVTSSAWTGDPLTAANQTYLYASGSGGLNLYTATGSATPVIVTTNGYQRVYVSGDTNTLAGTKVGIGNSTPLGLLDLGTLASTPKFFWYGSSSANQAYVAGVGLNLGSASNSTSFFLGYGSGAGSTNFEWLRGNSVSGNYPWTSYTQLMTLTSGGGLTVVGDITSNAYVRASSGYAIANVGGDICGSGGSTNYIGIRDGSSNFKFATHTSGAYSGRTGLGTSVAAPQAILDLGQGYGTNGAKVLFYNDNNSGELSGTKVGIYMDRFSQSNSVSMVFPYASGTNGYYHVAYKDTGGTTIVDLCYVTPSSSSWSFPSDERIKDVECEVTGALEGIDQIRTVFYALKRDPNKRRKIGTLAQDWLKVLPEVIDVPEAEFDLESGEGQLALATSDTTAYLLAALKELKAEFRAYKASHP